VDSLGKTLSGLDMQGQKDLSTALGDFAQKVGSEVLTSQKGRTVYAGGDDFLGFVNLAYLFDVLNDIHKAFDDEVKTLFPNLTFSTSIVIAHYKTPLHKVLDYSRELLEESKKHFEDKKKNGIGIMVMSSNAVISKTICRYGDVALLQKMKKAEMAKNLHFKLAQIFDYLGEMRYNEFLTQKAMMTVEIKRLLKREEGSFDEMLYDQLIAFFGNQTKGDSYTIDFDNFIGFLKTLEQLRKVMP
jgi:CRISPR-associated protein Cmr2